MPAVLGAASTGATESPWAFSPHPEVWALVLALGIGYAWALQRLAPVDAQGRAAPVRRREIVTYYGGLALLWVASDWPMHDISEDYLFSVHMVQHFVFTLIAPPIMLLGTPSWLLRRLLVEPDAVYRVVKVATKPLVAAITYNAVTLFTHWPVIVNTSLESGPFHFGVHVVLVVTAVQMWMPVVNKVPELPTMAAPVKMLYLFLQSVLPTVPASFITFAEQPVYDFYANVPRPFGLDVIGDQQLAGLIMKIGGGMILWSAIILIFMRWYATEADSIRGTTLTWNEVERRFAETPDPPKEPAPG